MNQSGFPLTKEMKSILATGYIKYEEEEGKWPPPKAPFPNLGAFIGSGGLVSNVEDLSKFISFQFSKKEKQVVLRGSSLREMRQPVCLISEKLQKNGYIAIGLPWFIGKFQDHNLISHSGETSGYITNVAFIPELELGIIILTNSQGGNISILRNKTLNILVPLIKSYQAASLSYSSPFDPFDGLECSLYCGKYRHIVKSFPKESLIVSRENIVEVRWFSVSKKLVIVPLFINTFYEDRNQDHIFLVPYGDDHKHVFRIKNGYFQNEKVIFFFDECNQLTNMKLTNFYFEKI